MPPPVILSPVTMYSAVLLSLIHIYTHENNAASIFELLIEDVGGTDLWGDGENINSTQSNTRAKEYAAAEVGGWYLSLIHIFHTFHIRKIVVLIKKMYFCTNHESNDA